MWEPRHLQSPRLHGYRYPAPFLPLTSQVFFVFEFFFHETKLWFSAAVHMVTESKLLL